MAYKKLGEILVDAGLIDNTQLNIALEYSKEHESRLGEALIDSGTITERQLIDTLKLQLGVDYIDLSKVTIPNSMAQMVPVNLAKRYRMVPVRVSGDSLYLAIQDPLNFKAIEEARTSSHKRVIPMITTRALVDNAIATLYGNESVSRAIDDLQVAIGNASNPTEIQSSASDDTSQAPAIRLVNSIIERAAASNASDIHIEPREDGLTIRMRVDGVLHKTLTVPQNLQNAVISRIKIMGDMDIAERRIPLDGRANVRVNQRDFDLRISTLPTKYGEKIVIRFLEKSESLLSRKGIGLEGKHLELYKDLIHNANGVILISGPTGSGKSTTMYTMVGDLNSEEVNLITLEDPIEYDMPGVNQVQINEKVGMTFANGLRAILRQDPDIIAVGEIRDGETAEIAMRSAITGHLVLSTIHTNSAVATLDRLVDIGVEPYLITSALKGVIAQRLVRRLCPACKCPYTPTQEELEYLEMDIADPEQKFYRPVGCAECLNTGYRGRIAVFEMLIMTNEVKRKLRAHASNEELLQAIEESGFESMMVNCRRLVKDGVTTVDETRRILDTTDD